MTTPSRDCPLVLPDPFSGKGNWESWLSHFEDVAAVSSWDDDQKLLWLRVCLTDQAFIPCSPFSGKGNWESWLSHFEDVAAVNSWDDDQKLLWLRVCFTDQAFIPASLQLLTKAKYEDSKKALTEWYILDVLLS